MWIIALPTARATEIASKYMLSTEDRHMIEILHLSKYLFIEF